jgi:hypothetical protein
VFWFTGADRKLIKNFRQDQLLTRDLETAKRRSMNVRLQWALA